MSKIGAILILSAVIVTAASVVIWLATGGDWYTKFEVVEQVPASPDPDDPLVAAGFYEDVTVKKTVIHDDFRLGLLPAPAGLFDKHALSVLTLSGPLWLLGLGALWHRRRRTKMLRRQR